MATRTTTILFIQPVAERGGSDHALLRMIRLLPRDRLVCPLAIPAPRPLTARFVGAGAPLHVVRMQRISTSHGARAWIRYAGLWPVSVARLWWLARRVRADVVHSNS